MDRLLLNTIAALNAEDEPHRDLCGFRKNAERMTDLLIDAMFPCYANEPIPRERALSEAAALLRTCLDALSAEPERADAIVFALFDALPGVLRLLKTDLAAAYVGDPAARGADEIIVSSAGSLCLAVCELDGKPVGGKDPVTLRKLQDFVVADWLEKTEG